MGYVGNLTCDGCGLTFTARWGSLAYADEYRCANDHIVHVDPSTGVVVAVDGLTVTGPALVTLRGLCPSCGTELATGRLPRCPVCGDREHQVHVVGTYE